MNDRIDHRTLGAVRTLKVPGTLEVTDGVLIAADACNLISLTSGQLTPEGQQQLIANRTAGDVVVRDYLGASLALLPSQSTAQVVYNGERYTVSVGASANSQQEHIYTAIYRSSLTAPSGNAFPTLQEAVDYAETQPGYGKTILVDNNLFVPTGIIYVTAGYANSLSFKGQGAGYLVDFALRGKVPGGFVLGSFEGVSVWNYALGHRIAFDTSDPLDDVEGYSITVRSGGSGFQWQANRNGLINAEGVDKSIYMYVRGPGTIGGPDTPTDGPIGVRAHSGGRLHLIMSDGVRTGRSTHGHQHTVHFASDCVDSRMHMLRCNLSEFRNHTAQYLIENTTAALDHRHWFSDCSADYYTYGAIVRLGGGAEVTMTNCEINTHGALWAESADGTGTIHYHNLVFTDPGTGPADRDAALALNPLPSL